MMSFQCRLTFSIKNIKINQCDGKNLTAKLHFGDETIFALRENENSKFSREITISYETQDVNLTDDLRKNSPKKLVLYNESEEIGECKIDWIDMSLEEITKEEFESSETELEYEIIKNLDGDSVVNGTVLLFISFAMSKTTPIFRATSFAFEAFGGTIEPEELLCDLNKKTSPVESLESIDKEKEYYLVDGKLINLNDIRGNCTNTKCPIALLAQHDLEEMRKMKCDCKTKCSDNTRFINNIRAINPYISRSEGSLNMMDEITLLFDDFDPPSEGPKMMHQRDGTCYRTNNTRKFEDNVCPNCLRSSSYDSRETDCALCQSKNMTTNRTSASLKTPVLVSMSEEFYTNRLPATTSAGVRPRGCPCCVKNKKKCPDCIQYGRKLSDRRYNSSSQLDMLSETSSLRSRLSMYGSVNNNNRKYYTSGAKKGMNDSYKMKRLSNESYGDDTTHVSTRNGTTRSQREKSRNRKKGQVPSNDSEMTSEHRDKNKDNYGNKRNKRGSYDGDSDMTCAERLAMLRRKLKSKRMARKRVSKTMHVKSRYSYRFGKRPPGMKIGHRECTRNRGLVPKNMGWLWNVPTLGINKLRIGWKPGAVTKPIKELMMHFLANYPCDTLPVTKQPKKSIYTDLETPCTDPCNRSTLQVKKQNGEYLICMNPLKDSEDLRPGESPYLMCPPLKFKIEKDSEQQKLDYCRDTLRKMGFCECTCPDASACKCRTTGEKQLLQREMKRLSIEVGLQVPMTNEDFTVSNNEEAENNVDIEFTPPSAAVGKKQKIQKKDTRATETQYNDKDFLVPVPTDKKLINAGKTGIKGTGTEKGGTKAPGMEKGGSGKGSKSNAKKGGAPVTEKGGLSTSSKAMSSKTGANTTAQGSSSDAKGSNIKGKSGRKNGKDEQNKHDTGLNKTNGGGRKAGGAMIRNGKNEQNKHDTGLNKTNGDGRGTGGAMMSPNKTSDLSKGGGGCIITDMVCQDTCLGRCCRASCIQTPFYDPCCKTVCSQYC